MFAEHDFPKIDGKQSLFITVLTMLPLYLEQFIVTTLHYSVATDVFFMLPPVVFGIFSFFLSTQFTVTVAPQLRAFSTITYCLHASMSMVIVFLSAKIGISFVRFSSSVTLWFIVVILSAVATLILLRLQKIPGFRWVRFSH